MSTTLDMNFANGVVDGVQALIREVQRLESENARLKLLAESETKEAHKYRVILSDLLHHYGKYEGLVMLMDIVERARAATHPILDTQKEYDDGV